ncbi:MAG: hypothetical protein DHS20C18_47940 [Saprospiraceae bacterium]|nr:MAG: hypothetical protein DHS20C18_47940 [Saprospiraceae bacterium]
MMEQLQTFGAFLLDNKAKLLEQMLEHLGLTFLSLLLAVLIAVPTGIFIARNSRYAGGILGFTNILQTIPSIALLGFMIPILGIGVKPAIFALFLYALLPILRNTYTGIREVDASVVEAARGIGMSDWQILRQVELPLAMPVLFAGIRTATVINVGVATLAAYIGAGGLGEFIFGGIALNNTMMILAGSIPAALLAVFFDQALAALQRFQGFQNRHLSVILLVLLPLMSGFFWASHAVSPGRLAGFDPEFSGRADGYGKLVEVYDLTFNTLVLNAGLMYEAVKEGLVDVIGGYSTDGRIKAFDLVVLKDDRNVFPPYHCAPLLRGATAAKYPELKATLDLLAGKISDATMTDLNYRVDHEKRSPAEVATAFLKSVDLWQPDRMEGGPKIVIGSKIFTEQYILVEIFAQLINGYTDLDVDAKVGLGGTKICFDAMLAGEVDLYLEYTGTGFQVILSPPDSVIQSINADADAVYDYVKTEFEQQYNLLWLSPLGFNNTYALMVRAKQAKEKGWVNISDLGR